MPNTINSGFKGLGIKPSILAIIHKMGLENSTPIQAKAIPLAVSGKDLIGIAQTGTGKTLAFGIPLIQRLAGLKGQALVVLPTRELANQVEESLKQVGRSLGLRTVSIIGGEAMGRQLFALRRRPHVIIATPGRLMDHVKRRSINLHNICILVLDEADMMFDMGFAPQIEEIINLIPKQRQTMLFSATMPAPIIRLAEKHLSSPLQIEVAPAGSTAELVDQEIYLIKREDRQLTLEKILNDYRNLVLIFVRTKHGAANLNKRLKALGYKAAEIHSNLSFAQRKRALADFKSGEQRILVATDVAARGLDINDIQLVVNFDLPDNSEDYVHRIGRTARAGKGGKAISFALPEQRREIQKIERLIRKNLPLIKIGDVEKEERKIFSFQKRYAGRGRFSPRRQAAPNFDSSSESKTGYHGVRRRFYEKKNVGENKSRPSSSGAYKNKFSSPKTKASSGFSSYKKGKFKPKKKFYR